MLVYKKKLFDLFDYDAIHEVEEHLIGLEMIINANTVSIFGNSLFNYFYRDYYH